MKKVIIGIIIGIMISSGAYAAVSLSSDKVSYKDTTVKDSLDNLFDESVSGKTKIAEAITNKGVETLNTDSYDTIVSNINNISTGNPNLRYDDDTGYIQAIDENGNWKNIYVTNQLPLIYYNVTVTVNHVINESRITLTIKSDSQVLYSDVKGTGNYGGNMNISQNVTLPTGKTATIIVTSSSYDSATSFNLTFKVDNITKTQNVYAHSTNISYSYTSSYTFSS